MRKPAFLLFGQLFPISSKWYTIPPVVEQWLEQNIDQWIHQVGSIHQTTVSGCFIYNRATFCPVTKKKKKKKRKKRERERNVLFNDALNTFYLRFYGYMASDIWLRTTQIVKKETRCRHIGYSYQLTARVLLYAPSHRQDDTYHGLCYTSRGALAGTRNSSMGPPHEGSIWRPIAPWANALPLSYVPLQKKKEANGSLTRIDPRTHGNPPIASCAREQPSLSAMMAISRSLACCLLPSSPSTLSLSHE